VEVEKNSKRMAVVSFLFGRPVVNAKQLADALNMHSKLPGNRKQKREG